MKLKKRSVKKHSTEKEKATNKNKEERKESTTTRRVTPTYIMYYIIYKYFAKLNPQTGIVKPFYPLISCTNILPN